MKRTIDPSLQGISRPSGCTIPLKSDPFTSTATPSGLGLFHSCEPYNFTFSSFSTVHAPGALSNPRIKLCTTDAG